MSLLHRRRRKWTYVPHSLLPWHPYFTEVCVPIEVKDKDFRFPFSSPPFLLTQLLYLCSSRILCPRQQNEVQSALISEWYTCLLGSNTATEDPRHTRFLQTKIWHKYIYSLEINVWLTFWFSKSPCWGKALHMKLPVDPIETMLTYIETTL